MQTPSPTPLDAHFGATLRCRKADFVMSSVDSCQVIQHGCAHISAADWPGWPAEPAAGDTVIETFVASENGVTATGNDERCIAAWSPLAAWMNTVVRAALAEVGVHLAGDAYVTASTTPCNELEGLAHLDDGIFMPDDSVSMVAIIGEHAGPRVATTNASHPEIRAMSTLAFDQDLLDSFSGDGLDHCAAAADELVVFPQFGQIHAGPAARHVAHLAPNRQLLVMRAAVVVGQPATPVV